MDHHQILLSILYQLVRCLLDLATVLVRPDLSKKAELLVYGTRTPCCAQKVPASVIRPPTKRG